MTGTGKTVFAIEAIKQALSDGVVQRILVIVPKIVILEQVWLKELYLHGFGPDKVGVFYSEAKEYAPITLTTMVSVSRLNLELFDAFVIDEVHNMSTDRLQEILDYPVTFKLGLSATVTSREGTHWRLMRSFDFNTYSYDAKKATHDKIISELSFVNVGVSFVNQQDKDEYDRACASLAQAFLTYKGLKNTAEAGHAKGVMWKALNERNRIVYEYFPKLRVVVDIIVKHKNNKVIVFNQRNEVSKSLYWMLLDHDVKALVVNSDVSNNERDKLLKEFNDCKQGVLLASISLDEGYNLPSIDVGIMLSGNSMERQLIQRTGRILRKTATKTRATMYQVFLRSTIEEKHAVRRAEFFKQLTNQIEEVLL